MKKSHLQIFFMVLAGLILGIQCWLLDPADLSFATNAGQYLSMLGLFLVILSMFFSLRASSSD